MPDEREEYLAILTASYEYEPQSDDEIAIKEDQILLLIERVDDDWWKVKVKGNSQEGSSPAGLVPAAYVEPAQHTSKVKVLYDYDAAADGELSVQEDELLLVFGTEEDWILVQSQKDGGKAGFIPGNYVEQYIEDVTSTDTRIVVPQSPPVGTYVDPAVRVASTKASADGIETWSVSEVDKKGKKKKGTLGIGNGALFFASESDKTPVQKWKTADVQNISSEKPKHITIETGGTNPNSLHFSVGSKDTVEEIISKYQLSKTLNSPARSPSPEDTFLPKKPSVHFSDSSPVIIPNRVDEEDPERNGESHSVENDSKHAEADTEHFGIALYDFAADGEDELSVSEGEHLTILERDGDEWWKCRNSRGEEGVVPASYIESSQNSDDPPISSSQGGDEAAEAVRRQAEMDERQAKKEEKERAEQERKKKEVQKRAEVAAKEVERKKRKEAAARASQSAIPGGTTVHDNSGSSSSRPSSEIGRPPPDRTRVWHDRTGQFRVEAAFLGFNNGKLRLHKVNGVIVEVPSEKMSLEDMNFVGRLMSKNSRPTSTRKISEDDVPLGLSRPAASSAPAPKATQAPKSTPKIDWFDFFLSAGCDIDDCTRYAASFEKDKLDEALLPDISEGTMRILGVREGDIIRIKKAIEKRKPTDNLQKPSPYIQDQVRRDEELARQLQAQEGGNRNATHHLFSEGPGGALKNRTRRRPPSSKNSPAVDLDALTTASDQIQRPSSPQILTPTSAPVTSAPAIVPPRSSSATVTSNGFDDNAWTNRPSSAKPLTASPANAPRSASVNPTPPTTTSATTTPAPTSASVQSPSQSLPASTTPASTSLSKTTESDIFDQLARLSEMRKPPPPQPLPLQSSPPPSVMAPSYAGPSPSVGNLPNASFVQQSPQPYNGPRGPFAPVPTNQSLLQPLIPLNTGFTGLVPTRPGLSAPPLPSNPSPSPLSQQPNNFQPAHTLTTGMPFNNFNSAANASAFTGLQAQYTGFNPTFGTPFNPPPVPSQPITASSANNNSPANVFAQMKSGTFANEINTLSQPQPALNTQPTGWGQSYQGGYAGFH